MNDKTITQGQLTSALRWLQGRSSMQMKMPGYTYWTPEGVAYDVFNYLKNAPEPKKELKITSQTVPNADETLTVAELHNVLKASKGMWMDAHGIYQRIQANRDASQWETNDIVRSGAGNIYKKLADGDWEDQAGTKRVRVRHDSISRPITLIGHAT